MKKILFVMAAIAAATFVQAKTLIVYYSFTNNVHTIVSDLRTQIDADVVRIEPAEKGLDYAANGYAIGSAQIQAIRNNPDDPSSYPAIDPVAVNPGDYDVIIVAAPLWWSNMAAPLQTYLFDNGARMADKHIGLIVSSASSGIANVVADAKRLIPNGDFLEPNLWIRSSQTSNCHTLLSDWLEDIDYAALTNAVSDITADDEPQVISTPGSLRVTGHFDRLTLYDISGSSVIETAADNISTTALAPGIYIVRIDKPYGASLLRKILVN